MNFGSFDRRQFLAGGGAAFVCTLAGHKLFLDQPADLPKLAREVQVPPKVAAAEGPGQTQFVSDVSTAAANAQRRYWIRAEERRWDIVPTGRDEMMDKPVSGKTRFPAYVYRGYTANFARPLNSGKIPGPLIQANVGETVAVHFQNKLSVPVTMHPHGIFYSEEMDGATRASTRTPVDSSSRDAPSPTSGTRARGRRASGYTTTTVPSIR